MVKSLLVFLPKQLDIRKTGYIKGFLQQFPDCRAFYVTSYKQFNSYCSDCIGFIGRKKNSENCNNFLLQLNNGNSIFIDNKVFNSDPVIQIIYDYNDFKQSYLLDVETNYGRHFQALSNILKENKNIINGKKSIWMLILNIIIYFMNIILLVKGSYPLNKSIINHFISAFLKIKKFMHVLCYCSTFEGNYNFYKGINSRIM